MSDLNFQAAFHGGPFDKTQLLVTQNIEYIIFLGQLVGSEPQALAIYEFCGDRVATNCLERVYQYVETMDLATGKAFMQKHGELSKQLPALRWQLTDGRHELVDSATNTIVAIVVTDLISGEWAWQRLVEPHGEGSAASLGEAMHSAEIE
ncbi:hypothetical protein [Anatilimnocola floriformis]|uniref:hypothetical protein n=1 Tax=Anatilimnocola floriformis TaxID=2948575 RepID=UPI0020C45A21|nr:hypothetical protein [Anatilimnocola floriformis]